MFSMEIVGEFNIDIRSKMVLKRDFTTSSSREKSFWSSRWLSTLINVSSSSVGRRSASCPGARWLSTLINVSSSSVGRRSLSKIVRVNEGSPLLSDASWDSYHRRWSHQIEYKKSHGVRFEEKR